MSIKGKRTIFVGPADDANHKPLQQEGISPGGILPGTLVTNDAGTFAIDTQTATDEAAVLVQNRNEMKQLSVDVATVAGETSQAIIPRSGEFLNVFVAAGNNITARNTPLTRGGAGALILAGVGDDVVAYSDEIINVTANALVRVRFA